MSLGIAIKGPEGLVLAADSRVTLVATKPDRAPLPVNFDNATKVLSFQKPHNFVGALNYGQAVIGLRTPYGFLPELEANLPDERLGLEEFAKKLSKFFGDQWGDAVRRKEIPHDYTGPDMTFVVAGFDEGEPYGRCFLVNIPGSPEPDERSPNQEFGITWGGQNELVARLLLGFDPRLPGILSRTLGLDGEQTEQLVGTLSKELALEVPFQAMPLQDCVDLAILLIRATMGVLNVAVGVRGVGGPIEVATITRRDGFRFVQRKQIAGEGKREVG